MPARYLLLVLLALSASVGAAQVQVAVASNFAAPFARISEAFAADTGHVVRTSLGATGKFYAQTKVGAPCDVLLAADDEMPRRLLAEGAGVSG